MLPRSLILPVVLGGCGIWGAAAPAASINSQWTLHIWQSNRGLPNNYVTGTVQTADGYLWIPTYQGLARFDGVNFESLPLAQLPGVQNFRIRAACRSGTDGLWIINGAGQVIHLRPGMQPEVIGGLPNFAAVSMIEDSSGDLWISIDPDHLFRIHQGKATEITSADGLPSAKAPCFAAIDVKGRVWAGEGHELGRFKGGKFTPVVELPYACDGLAAAHDGGMWIFANLHLYSFHEGSPLRELATLSAHQPNEPAAIFEDHSGAVWLGTTYAGLFRYDGARLNFVLT